MALASTHCIVLYSCGKSQSSHFWLRHNSSFVCAPPFSSSEQRPSPHSLARRERKLAAPRDFAPAWATSSEGPQRGRLLRSLRPLPRLATFAVWLVLRGGPESEQGSSHRPCAGAAQGSGERFGSMRFGLATLPRCACPSAILPKSILMPHNHNAYKVVARATSHHYLLFSDRCGSF